MNQVDIVSRPFIDATQPNKNTEIILSPKWVRGFFGGEFIINSKNAVLVRNEGRPPIYYFPRQDVRSEFLKEQDHSGSFPGLGRGQFYSLVVGDKVAENAAWRISDPNSEVAELGDYVAFKWNEIDAWFEEDEQVYVHPRDPYTRIDVAHSSRHVKVELNGEIVAETERPDVLFETGLIPRYYIPLIDVRLDLLESSDTHTECPYKGVASYYSVNVRGKNYKDIAWYYPFPLPEVGKIRDKVAFYSEKVDAFFVDSEKI
jgi:uncharacterized protein (DUF427 family)